MRKVKSLLLKAGMLVGLVAGTAAISPAADASSIGGIFLYRTRAHVLANCAGPTRYLADLGMVSLHTHRVFGFRYLGETTNGYFATDKSEAWSATRADQQRWCYRGDFYNEYFAANTFHRFSYVYWWCAGGGCAYLFSHNTAWISGL